MNEDINIDLIPLEQKLIIDLHGLTKDETNALIDREIEIIKTIGKSQNIKVIVLLHGYSKGKILKKFIREEYINKEILKKFWGQNPGISYYLLKDNK